MQALVAKIDVRKEAAYTKAYPGQQLCDVVIQLRDGRAIRSRCEVMKGEPTHPHRAQDVEKKYFDLMSPVWGADRTRTLYDALLALEDIADTGNSRIDTRSRAAGDASALPTKERLQLSTQRRNRALSLPAT